MVLQAISSGLDLLGFNVVTVNRASAALEVVRRGHPPVDVVLTDLAMPEMDGVQLAAAVRSLDRGLPVVAISGDPYRHLPTLDDAKNFAAVLEKPCEFTVLRDVLLRVARCAAGSAGVETSSKPWPVPTVQTEKQCQLGPSRYADEGAESAPAVKPTVLFVEPDDTVRRLFIVGMTAQGFQIVATEFPVDAIAAVSRGNPPIDVVITALSLPKLNGVPLASALRRSNPDLPIIALSGDPLRYLRTPAEAKDFVAVLTKPCSLEKLRETIFRCLGQSD